MGTPDSNSGGCHSRSRDNSTISKDMFKNTRLMDGIPTNTNGGGGKADSKVLEWGSFPPTVIREYYLGKVH